MEFLPVMSDGKKVYAGFWKRFCSIWVDLFILLPLILLLNWIEGLDRNLAILITIPYSAIFFLYHLYFNANYGGTLGKLAVGIRITRPDGTKIGWTEALKRSSVDMAFTAISIPIQIWALTQVDNGQYAGITFIERARLLQQYYPAWFSFISILQQIWIWSEVVVLLFNKRKRAIHDFIAGTVVIHKEFTGTTVETYDNTMTVQA